MIERKNNCYCPYYRGEMVSGTILSFNSLGAFVNIGGLVTGFIPSDRLSPIFKLNDTVLALVTDSFTPDEYIILDNNTALKLASECKELNQLRAGQCIDVILSKKGPVGMHGKYNNIDVFLPNSQMKDMNENYVNQMLKVMILQLNYYKNTIIVSLKHDAK